MLFTHPRRGLATRLVFAAALTLLPIACGGGHSHSNYPPPSGYTPPPGGSQTGYLTFQWTLADVGNPNAAQSLACSDVGAGFVVLNIGGASETFPCSSFQATSRAYVVGAYDVTVSLYGDPAIFGNSTTLLDTITTPGEVLAPGANDFGVADFYVNSFVLSWTISRGGIGTTCQNVGASRVELDVTFAGQSTPTQYFFNCDNTSLGAGGLYTSATMAIPYANPPYSVSWQAFLLNAAGQDLTPGTATQYFNVTASVQADLGSVAFAL